jgi:imidazolonepropionase-like amidohydrolase
MKRLKAQWVLVAGILAGAAWMGVSLRSTRVASADEPGYFAIRGAKIYRVSGPPLENGTVVIADGLIQSVSGGSVSGGSVSRSGGVKDQDAKIPPEALVIDGQGLSVYPGMIDVGTDIGFDEEPKGEHGGASDRGGHEPAPGKISMGPEDRPGTTPWQVAADEFNTADKRIEKWRDAGVTTVLSSPSGGMIPGQSSLMDLSGGRTGEMAVVPRAALDLSFKPTGGFFSFPGSLMGAIAYVRQVMWDTEWYQQTAPIYSAHPAGLERPAYDRTEQVMAGAMARSELFLVPGNNQVQILRALRLINKWRLHSAIEGGQQGYAVAAEIGAQRVPVIVSLKWPAKAKDADPEEETPLRELRFRDRAPGTPAALARANVTFAFSSGGLETPKDIQKALKKATDAGLTEDAALRALTLNAAEILGVTDRMGSIEKGKIANLVVTDGDFFSDKTKVKMVFVDGKRFEVHQPPKGEKPAAKPAEKTPAKQRQSAPSKPGQKPQEPPSATPEDNPATKPGEKPAANPNPNQKPTVTSAIEGMREAGR